MYKKHVLDGSLSIPSKELGGPVRGPQYERNRPGVITMDSTDTQGENKERATNVEGHLQEDVDTDDKTGHSGFLKQRQIPFDILNEKLSGDGALQVCHLSPGFRSLSQVVFVLHTVIKVLMLAVPISTLSYDIAAHDFSVNCWLFSFCV